MYNKDGNWLFKELVNYQGNLGLISCLKEENEIGLWVREDTQWRKHKTIDIANVKKFWDPCLFINYGNIGGTVAFMGCSEIVVLKVGELIVMYNVEDHSFSMVSVGFDLMDAEMIFFFSIGFRTVSIRTIC